MSGNDSKIQMHKRKEDVNVYRQDYERRSGMDKRSRRILYTGICALVMYFIVIVLPVGVITENGILLPAQCFEQTRGNIASLFGALGGNGYLGLQTGLFRYAAVALAGAALSVSGAVYQGSFRNALASPSTLGVQSGGVLGGTIYVMFFADYSQEVISYSELERQLDQMNMFQRSAQCFAVLAGCMAGVIFIVTVSRIIGRGKVSSIALILTGSVFGSFISGGVGLLQYYLLLNDPYGAKTYELRYLMLGTFDRITSPEMLAEMGIPVLICIAAMFAMRGKLNLLVFGEEEARTMGINADLVRNVMVGVVTLMTAVIISFCGQIGFVGFIVPHLARRITGSDFRYLVPESAFLGAALMLFVYYIATLIGYSSNINFVTSLAGGSIFLIMIMRFRNRRYADWA